LTKVNVRPMPIMIITEKTSQTHDLRAAIGGRFGQILPAPTDKSDANVPIQPNGHGAAIRLGQVGTRTRGSRQQPKPNIPSPSIDGRAKAPTAWNRSALHGGTTQLHPGKYRRSFAARRIWLLMSSNSPRHGFVCASKARPDVSWLILGTAVLANIVEL
jgi:hypothetical protein